MDWQKFESAKAALADKIGCSVAEIEIGFGPLTGYQIWTEQQPKPKRIRCKLDTVADVKAEACKLYRSVRAKEIDASEAGKLAYLLQIIAKLAETADLERRLAELEETE